MKRNEMRKFSAVAFVFGLAVFCVGATKSYGAETSVCATGVAEPPFLSYGVDPNVLLMIDNSGSMYDPAYIQTTPLSGSTITTPPQCYDESYGVPDPLTPTIVPTYVGYFEKDSWYSYGFTTDKQFTKLTAAPGSCGYSGADSTGTYLCLNLTTTTPKTVDAFAAKGNFLNWAASSKFDIQKKILTGGKYDSTNLMTMLESRGCSGRRFVKQVTLTNPTGGYKLALGVRGPMEVYDAWRSGTPYVIGDIVQYSGTLYKAISSFTSAAVFDGNTKWEEYKDTRWYPGHAYPPGASVYDVASSSWYWTESGGPSSDTSPLATDTNDMWEPYHGTEIEIFDIKVGGFNVTACQEAIADLDGTGNLGNLKGDTQDCMGYTTGGGNTEAAAQQTAFNHILQECWYYNKNGSWQPGAGTVTSLKNDCESLYGSGVSPGDITPWDAGYVCYGTYTRNADKSNGYVGRCWETTQNGTATVCTSSCGSHALNSIWSEGTSNTLAYYSCQDKLSTTDFPGGELYLCDGHNSNQCNSLTEDSWTIKQTCTGGSDLLEAGWTNDDDVSDDDLLDNNNGDMCVDTALKDFCSTINVPEVIDPSDSTSITGETWNAPAMLVDSGIMGQLDKPLAIMKGRITEAVAPEGLIQRYADDMRIGAMRFNVNGAKTECDDNPATATDTAIRYECPDDNRDGAKVISDIDKSSAHTTDLVEKINGIEANSWTPLGEAMFTAIGYYTQKDQFKCQTVAPNDFTVGIDPVQYWCQNNHIILITDGSSTADLNSTMKTAINTSPFIRDADDATDDLAVYNDGLFGSPFLDNFTYYAAKEPATSLFTIPKLSASDGLMKDKQNIKTHIVVSGTLRDMGATEYSPDVILPEAAENAKINPSDAAPLYVSTNYDDLETNLEQVFAEIRAGSSAGSAASVISSSRGGEGAIYQAIFWPSKSSSTDPTISVKWAGEVHSLFIDTNGHMYEDTDNDRTLSGADKRVTIYFDNTALLSKGCYAALNSDGTCNAADQVDMDAVHYLWSANDWLSKISNSVDFPPYNIDDKYLNRANYLSNDRRRYIFTWNDLDNDGIVDANETLPFVSKTVSGPATTDWAGMISAADLVTYKRRPVTNDFNAADNGAVNNIVDWVRGVEVPGLRSRTVNKKMNVGGTIEDKEVVWRLGDVVHSTPTAVARPMEGLHLLYNDTSYAKFVARWANRRHMAYFGANDGMMHAVNGGFYDDNDKKFYLTPPDPITGIHSVETGVPELGAEMWAYVPYNLLPHLQCLTNPGYNHKFYVDQRPRVFDARIFPDDGDNGIHPGGWGTVLVGSMRFGGARVEADRLNGDTNSATDNRTFTSSYFLLDITNPEAPPVLLGEFTMLEGVGVDLGFTTSSPTPVVMKNDAGAGEWYLLMGSGPTASDPPDVFGTFPIFDSLFPIFDSLDAIKGYSDQKPKVAVFPLKWLTTDKHAFRIPNALPTSTTSGVFTLENSNPGFVSDMISVDYDLDPNYMTDAVYFGTVEHGAITDSAAVPGNHSYDDVWDGQLYRIVMRELDADGKQVATTPDEWAGLTPPYDATGFLPLFNAHQPITAAPAVGTDLYNYWIYFGTGRFFDAIDKPDDAQQSFYGIKELTDCTGKFTWPTIDEVGLVDVSNILVHQAADAGSATLHCTSTDLTNGTLNTTTCLPKDENGAPITNFSSLIPYIAGSSTTLGTTCVDKDADGVVETQTGQDGWFRDFQRPRERNVGQATLLGGLLTFTTYQPFADLCQQEGVANLYGLYYQTGTPWYKTVFGARGLNGEEVLGSISLGRGLATTPNLHVGSGEGPTAFVQTSTGEIIELPQTNLPYSDFKPGRQSWQEE